MNHEIKHLDNGDFEVKRKKILLDARNEALRNISVIDPEEIWSS